VARNGGSNMALVIFRSEVFDIADQLAQLQEHREGLVEANSIRALYGALENVEHSVDVLKACVAALKYRVGLEVSGRNTGAPDVSASS
jgi:hypothetical protein